MSTLKLHSFSHKNTSLAQRDRLVFSRDEIDDFLSQIETNLSVELAVLSTCNRTEFYLFGSEEKTAWPRINNEILDFKGLQNEDVPSPDTKTGSDAAEHLFRVTASLESVALGENEILGQVKDAHQWMLDHPISSSVLDELFQFAIRCGKQIRTETDLCEGAISVSSVAVELAEKIFGSLESCLIMIIGAGEMAEKAAAHFKDRGAGSFIIANRSRDTGEQLAEALDGDYLPLDKISRALATSDVVLTATGSDTHLITSDDIEHAFEEGSVDPMFLIDISNPRNVSPDVSDKDGVYLYNMNDLESVVQSNLSARQQEIPKAEKYISNYLRKWEDWISSRDVRPTIATLAQYFEDVREQELHRHRNQIPEEELERLEEFSESLINKLLHYPIRYLRSAHEDDHLDAEDLNLVWSLYNLQEYRDETDEN